MGVLSSYQRIDRAVALVIPRMLSVVTHYTFVEAGSCNGCQVSGRSVLKFGEVIQSEMQYVLHI